MQVVGIAGLIGSGKTTVARIIAKHSGFRVADFADALKIEVMERLHNALETYVKMVYPSAHTFEPVEETVRHLLHDKKDPFTRALLQEYGTEVRRSDDLDYWVKALFRGFEQKDKVVIADMRFHNEYTAIMASPDVEWAAVIKVVRPGLQRYSAHTSEDMPSNPEYPWSAVIYNDGDLKKLEEQVILTWEAIYHPPQGEIL